MYEWDGFIDRTRHTLACNIVQMLRVEVYSCGSRSYSVTITEGPDYAYTPVTYPFIICKIERHDLAEEDGLSDDDDATTTETEAYD